MPTVAARPRYQGELCSAGHCGTGRVGCRTGPTLTDCLAMSRNIVSDWLRFLELEQFTTGFLENGYDDLETVKLIQRPDLEAIGVERADQQAGSPAPLHHIFIYKLPEYVCLTKNQPV